MRVFLLHRGGAFKTTILLASLPRVDADPVRPGTGTTRGSARRAQDHLVGCRTRRWASPRQDGDPSGGDPEAAASIADRTRPKCHGGRFCPLLNGGTNGTNGTNAL